ncbi:MAG: hypothetical protein OHK0052_04460 [Anaerolineales bacterium]
MIPMTSLVEAIKRLFIPPAPLPPGHYAYQSPNPQFPYRMHLRIEADSSGLLIVNAATVLHLNQTAAEYAYHLIHNTPQQQVIADISRRYRVDAYNVLQDYKLFIERLQTLIETPDLDPVTFLDFERATPYENPSAPYRLDCALTYRLPEGAPPDAAPRKRVDRELSTAEWTKIIQDAWQFGIPHILFTGGEPTLRDDLPQLLQVAEENGQVTGLLTDGLRLSDPAYLETLLQAGLDHALIVLNPDNPACWQSLATVLPADLFTAVHLTITPENASQTAAILQRLKKLGANAVSITAATAQLAAELENARQFAAEFDLPLIWDLPVPYSAINPIALETAEDSLPGAAGRAFLYVEPDGDVLPAQGINQPLGNLVTASFNQVWHAAAQG